MTSIDRAKGHLARAARALALGAWAAVLAGAAPPADATSLDLARGVQRVVEGVAVAPERAPGLPPREDDFRPVDEAGAVERLGATALWLRLTVDNPARQPVDRVLAVRFPYLDGVTLEAQLADGTGLRKSAGPRFPQGENLALFPAFRLTLPPGASVFYLRLDSPQAARAPLELHTPTAFHRLVLRDHLLIGAVLGAGVVLALYLSLLAGGPRDDRHAAFLGLTLATLGLVLVTTGIGKVWLWPGSALPTLDLVFQAQGLLLCTAAWYFRTVLRPGGLPKLVDRALTLLSVAGAASLLSPVLPRPAHELLHAVVAGIGPATLFVFAFILWGKARRREAGVLALGWAPAQAATLHWYLGAYEVAASHPDSHYLAVGAFAMLIAVYARDLSTEAQSAAIAAEHDPLTGLGNRTRMERAWHSLAAVRGPETVAVLQIDLDRFKALNDTLGHAAGDEALCEVSERFRAALRADDVLCRIGGDEFVALIPYTGEASVLSAIAERLIGAIREPIRTSAGDWTLGASIGIAVGDEEATLADLQRGADAALYRVKERGRNGYRFASPEDRSEPDGAAPEAAAAPLRS